MLRAPARPTLFPCTTLFRSWGSRGWGRRGGSAGEAGRALTHRSEEHTSELQSRENLVCRLLLEKKERAPLPEASKTRLRAWLACKDDLTDPVSHMLPVIYSS